VTGITAANKGYDGLTHAALTTTGAGFTGRLGNDALSVATATGNFSDKTAAAAKTVNITGITMSGTDAGNYNLATNTSSATADISKAPLTVTAANNSKVSGEANPALSVTVSGFVNGETAATADNYSGVGSASTSADATTPAGTAVIAASAGTLAADNYAFTDLVNGVLTITAAATSQVTSEDAVIATMQLLADSPSPTPTNFSAPVLLAPMPAVSLPDSGSGLPLTIGNFNVVVVNSESSGLSSASDGSPVTGATTGAPVVATGGQVIEFSSSADASGGATDSNSNNGKLPPALIALIQNAPPGLNMFVIDGGIRLPDFAREEQAKR
jgi:hypothetical protein